VQLATPAELLAAPATVMVAELTGANILQGTATTTDSGATIRLQGGGEIDSARPANGFVHVAVHPWQVQIADPGACRLTDTVLSVNHDRGALTVRLTRFTVRVPIGDNGHLEVTERSIVGLRAAPRDVHVLDAAE
jgi:ABC-type Fe3+/spermidine/putrescine transport system ATPase subunit